MDASADELPPPLISGETITAKDVAVSADIIPTTSKYPAATSGAVGERRVKALNLLVYKVHALGDYSNTIRLFGTTDSFSSQVVSPLVAGKDNSR